MKKIGTIIAFAIALALFCTARGYAQAYGPDLLSDCETFLKNAVSGSAPGSFYIAGGGHPEAYRCSSFVGAIQQLSTLERGHTLTHLCLPANSTLIQLIRVVVEYGHRHPEKLNEQAAELTLESLEQAFPCSR